jgi:hypothetical protein
MAKSLPLMSMDCHASTRSDHASAIAQLCSMLSIYFYLDGYDLTGCPLIKRKTLLKHIPPKDNTGRIRFTDHIIGNGEALFQRLEALNLERMVMKP